MKPDSITLALALALASVKEIHYLKEKMQYSFQCQEMDTVERVFLAAVHLQGSWRMLTVSRTAGFIKSEGLFSSWWCGT